MIQGLHRHTISLSAVKLQTTITSLQWRKRVMVGPVAIIFPHPHAFTKCVLDPTPLVTAQ